MTKVVLIFDSRKFDDKPNEQVFVEAHDESGNSINAGEWAADGEYESLTIDCDKFAHIKALADLKSIADIQSDPANAMANDYMRGMANGLLLAQSCFANLEPNYFREDGSRINAVHVIDANQPAIDPVTR